MSSSHQSNEQLNSKDLDYNYENECYGEEGDNPSGIDLTKLNNEYDDYIADLKKQLSMARELRKRSEVDSKTMEHRLNLLQNQEKYVMNQFLTTKKKIEQILINRTNAEVNMKYNNSSLKLITKRKMGQNRKSSYEFNNKRLINSTRNYGYDNEDEKNHNVIYPNEEDKNYGYSNGNENESGQRIYNNNNNNDPVKMIYNNNQQNIQQLQQIPEQSDDFEENQRKKQKIKQDLLLKLQEDENERLRLENELATIEREELKILKLFNKENKKHMNL